MGCSKDWSRSECARLDYASEDMELWMQECCFEGESSSDDYEGDAEVASFDCLRGLMVVMMRIPSRRSPGVVCSVGLRSQ